jgi:hypothetical protein
VEEIEEILQKSGTPKMQFKLIIEEIADKLILKKGIKTCDLIQNDFEMPADRIVKFMKNIKI